VLRICWDDRIRSKNSRKNAIKERLKGIHIKSSLVCTILININMISKTKKRNGSYNSLQNCFLKDTSVRSCTAILWFESLCFVSELKILLIS